MLKKKLGKNVYLKRLEEKDYKHLFYLRKKKSLTKYLNTISDNINDQKKFIIQEIKKKKLLIWYLRHKRSFYWNYLNL